MAVQISSYRPRMRLDNPASVYFPAQTVGGSSISESFTVPPPVSQRPQGPALVPGVAPPSKSGSVNASSGATGPPGSFDGRRMRSKSTSRRTVDYNASLINYVQNRIWQRDFRDMRALQPDASYNHLTVPPVMMLHKPVNCITTRCVRTATNKLKCPIFSTCWTPEGRRLVTGASSGEFTLWHGLTFSFETILQAHDSAVRTMIWSHNDLWMLTADHSGFVKYWQSNMNNVKMFQAHRDPVRGLRWDTLRTAAASAVCQRDDISLAIQACVLVSRQRVTMQCLTVWFRTYTANLEIAVVLIMMYTVMLVVGCRCQLLVNDSCYVAVRQFLFCLMPCCR